MNRKILVGLPIGICAIALALAVGVFAAKVGDPSSETMRYLLSPDQLSPDSKRFEPR